MISIPWLKFLFLINFHWSTNFILFTMFLRVPYLHNDSTIFKTYFFLLVYLFFLFFFFLSSFFPLFSSFFNFPFLSLFSSFFLFPNLYHFLNSVCRFLRAPLPCSRTFCCPAWCILGLKRGQTASHFASILILCQLTSTLILLLIKSI